MKNVKKMVLVGLITLSGLTSCDKVEDNSDNGTIITQNEISGDWKISGFFDSGKDETYHFTGYLFSFENGIVKATSNTNSLSGTYVLQNNSSGTTEWIINFGNVEPWDELTEDWKVIEKTTTLIRLEHVSGGNGGTDLLTFTK